MKIRRMSSDLSESDRVNAISCLNEILISKCIIGSYV